MFSVFQDYSFETFVDETETLQTDAALFSALDRATGRLGFERVIFSVFADPVLPAYVHHIGVHRHNLDQWDAFYAQKNHARIDPVAQALRTGAGAFAWEGMTAWRHLSRAQIDFLQGMKDIGVHHGVAVPLGNRTAVLGVSTVDVQAHPHMNLPLLSAIGTQFYRSFRRLNGTVLAGPGDMQPLTPTEREILCWLRDGRTDEDIGRALSISSSTVDSHLRNIFRKLKASNRLTAVLNGIRAGYVSL